MPLRIVDDNNETVVWSPVPMVWYIAVTVPPVVPGYGVYTTPGMDRLFLDTVIRNNNAITFMSQKTRPDVSYWYNVAIVPNKKGCIYFTHIIPGS